MALLWTWQTRTSIHQLLRLLELPSSSGRAFTQDELKTAHQELRHAGYLVDEGRRQGYTRLRDDARTGSTRVAGRHQSPGCARCTDWAPTCRRSYGWPLWDSAATVAFLRWSC
jgi:hypothetical protein